mgnify:CR=1 FL=1
MNPYGTNSSGPSNAKQTNKQTGISSLREVYRRLSSRESEVLHKLLEGLSNKKIADALHITEKTVENHITRIGKKVHVRGRGRLRGWLTSLKDRDSGKQSTPQNNRGRE